jgi:hypothetical protein
MNPRSFAPGLSEFRRLVIDEEWLRSVGPPRAGLRVLNSAGSFSHSRTPEPQVQSILAVVNWVLANASYRHLFAFSFQ